MRATEQPVCIPVAIWGEVHKQIYICNYHIQLYLGKNTESIQLTAEPKV